MARVAVVGAGAAGIGAVWCLLSQGHEVCWVESGGHLGGNCVGLELPDGAGGRRSIDIGVSDFNRVTFTRLNALIEELGLESFPICGDAHFASAAGQSLWAKRGADWHLRASLPDAERAFAELEEFNRRAVEVLHDERFESWSVGRYLEHLGVSESFREGLLLPRAAGCFPMPDRDPRSFGIVPLVRFWNAHGIVSDQPGDRHAVRGGMHRYPVAFGKWFLRHGGELRLRTRVLGIARDRKGVRLRIADGEDRHRELRADQVVLALHARQALHLLDDPSPAEREALRAFPYQRARVVVHRDASLVGSDRSLWGGFHYLVPRDGEVRTRPTITFHPNRLARLPREFPDVFVTMNPHREPDPALVLSSRFFLHPVGNRATDRARPRLEGLQGHRHTWFAGSHLRPPFVHESALRSGLDAAERLLHTTARYGAWIRVSAIAQR